MVMPHERLVWSKIPMVIIIISRALGCSDNIGHVAPITVNKASLQKLCLFFVPMECFDHTFYLYPAHVVQYA